MFKGYNTLKLCHATMKEIVQEWLDDRLGDDAPVVTSITLRGGGWWKSHEFHIEVRGQTEAPRLTLAKTS